MTDDADDLSRIPRYQFGVSRFRGLYTVVAGAVTIVLTLTLGPWPWGGVGLALTVVLGVRFVTHRIRWGIPFFRNGLPF